ncbi:hypothetical protein D3C75_780930 [compost metagenome]
MQHQWRVIKTFDVGAVFTQRVGHYGIARTGVHHANFLTFERVNRIHFGVVRHHDGLLCREVRRGEIDHCFTLVGDGDAGNNNVAIARIQGGENTFPRRVNQFDIKAFHFCDGLDDVDIEAFQLLLAVFKFKWTVSAARADHISLLRGVGGSENGGNHAPG